MKKILCFSGIFLLCAFLSACANNPVVELGPATANIPPQAKPEVVGSIPACAKYGSNSNFNDQRIVAFQKMVQLQILRIKSQLMTEESTAALSELELLRRRVSYPLLTPSLRPPVVTKILLKESRVFAALLEKRKDKDPQAQGLLDEVTDKFMPLLDNQDQWNCLERETQFNEDPIKDEVL